MKSSTMRGACRGLALLASATILAASAHAQNRAGLPPGAAVQSPDTGPGAELRRNLTTLADNPRSVSALNGAGRATLAMGDAEAAFDFFARAVEVEPQSARAKAGMASALVQLERPGEAMHLFAEALALGAPEAEIAGDRGLAYDALGDPRRAQADYALALRRGDDPEVRRRMALSLAISGQREAALRMIDGQLRAHDRAAWRTQAFVLALTGDAAGADRTARTVMPAGGAEAMAPFFARLVHLSPSQKAMAVHFGRFPSDGRTAASAGVDTGADPGAIALAEGGAPAGPPRVLPRPAEPLSSERRRPDSGDERVASLIPRRQTAEIAPAVTREIPPQPKPEPEPQPQPQSQSQEGEPQPVEMQVRPEPRPAEPAAEAQPEPSSGQEPAIASTDGTTGFTLTPQGTQPVIAPASAPPPPPSPPPPAPARSRLEDLAQVVASLPADPKRQPTRTERRNARIAEARPATERSATRSPPASTRNPARHWVQLAHAARTSLLPREYSEAKEKAPALLANRAPYSAFADRTNRLLIGPFDSRAAAQAFVRRLAGRDVPALAWTSPAGQEIERLRIPNEPRSSRTSRSDPEPRPAARPSRSRPEPEQRPPARRRRTR